MSMPTITVIPAYGKDYANDAECLAGWNSGKDFAIVMSMPPVRGTYINNQDRRNYAMSTEVRIRYNNKANLILLPPGDNDGHTWVSDPEEDEPAKECNTGHSHLPHGNCPGIGLI